MFENTLSTVATFITTIDVIFFMNEVLSLKWFTNYNKNVLYKTVIRITKSKGNTINEIRRQFQWSHPPWNENVYLVYQQNSLSQPNILN